MTDFFPKIDVRPAIDGRRRGVRKSLEQQTMVLARCTTALLPVELRRPSGEAGLPCLPQRRSLYG